MFSFFRSVALIATVEASEMDSCWFVGLRLARTPSRCILRDCSMIAIFEGQFVGPELPLVPLSRNQGPLACAQADVMKTEILQSVEEDIALSRSPVSGSLISAEFIEYLLEDTVLRLLKRVLLAKLEISVEGLHKLRAISNLFTLHYQRKTPEQWSAILHELHATDTFLAVMETLGLVGSVLGSSSFARDSSRQDLSTLCHFLFDIGSVLGFGPFERYIATHSSFISSLTSKVPCGYKARYTHEFDRQRILELPPISGPVDQARIFDKAADTANARYLDYMAFPSHQVAQFLITVADLSESDLSSAVEAMLFNQMRLRICPVVLRLSRVLDFSAVWRRVGVSLLEICRPQMTVVGVISASLNLIRSEVVLPVEVTEESINQLISALTSPTYAWSTHLFSGGHPSNPYWFAHRLLVEFIAVHNPLRARRGANCDEFKPPDSFRSRRKFAETYVAFGRAIGLRVRYGLNLLDMKRLAPILIDAIYDHVSMDQLVEGLGASRDMTRSESAKIKYLIERVYEPVFFIRKGITDVLGPVGVQFESLATWRSRFTTSANEFPVLVDS